MNIVNMSRLMLNDLMHVLYMLYNLMHVLYMLDVLMHALHSVAIESHTMTLSVGSEPAPGLR